MWTSFYNQYFIFNWIPNTKWKKKLISIRHPHYPEIIKFKVGSVKTTSTLSTSHIEDDLNNCEKLSMPGDGF